MRKYSVFSLILAPILAFGKIFLTFETRSDIATNEALFSIEPEIGWSSKTFFSSLELKIKQKDEGFTIRVKPGIKFLKYFSTGIETGTKSNDFSEKSIKSNTSPFAKFSYDFSRRWSANIGIKASLLVKSEFNLGAKYKFSPSLSVGLDGGYVIDKKGSSPFLRGGLSWNFGMLDQDGDWVPNKIDLCPYTPRGAIVDERGCPLDSDADGVFDGIDKCPGTPLAAFVDLTGCSQDSDGDGIPDGQDRCPNTPKDISVDTTGCPRDSDYDGIPDYADTCANTPEGAIVDDKGCPVDSDYDGIPDGIDQCPQTPTGFRIDRFGCPDIPTADREVIYDLFDENLELTAHALNQLETISERIRAYPHLITFIEIYTEPKGSDAYNVGRAKSVGEKIKSFLISKNIPEKTIEIIPKGKASPTATQLSDRDYVKRNRQAVFKTKEK